MTQLCIVTLILTLICPAFATAQAEHRQFTENGVRLHYTALGTGTPVVLVHGYTSSSASWLENGIAENLALDHKVLVLDARGHGRSDKPHTPSSYGRQMAADVIALLDHENLDSAHLVGYSMGGLLTLKAITLAPERFRSAVIGGQGWDGQGTGLGDEIVEAIAISLENGRGIEPLMRALTPASTPLSEAQLDDAAALINQTNDPKALAAVIRSADGWIADLTSMQANPVPAIAVVGDRDPLIAAARNLAGNLANLQRLEVLIGATHVAVVRDPAYAEKFGSLIKSFISSVELESEPAPLSVSD